MSKDKQIDVQKMQEYNALIEVIRNTVSEDNLTRICLSNTTLKTLAGYTAESTPDNFNPYVKNYIDKLSYDEHNRKVDEAKRSNNSEELKRLSREVMQMAGYVEQDNNNSINTFAKSFVDRTLLDRQLSKLYKAVEIGNKNEADEIYRKIYSMTSYSQNRPYGVVNEYAQSFVDNRIDKYIEKGIHTSNGIEKGQYAI